MLCFVTSVEEDECFQEKTNIAHQQLMKWKDKFFFPMSKEMSRILRHEKDSTLFDSRGTMEIFELFKRRLHSVEEPGGGSTSVVEPQEDTSADAADAQRDDTSQPWYAGCEPGGGPASAEVPQAEPEEDPSRIPEDDTMDPQVVADWERDHGPAEDEYLTDHATGSFSATYPWMLYHTGVFCARLEYGSIDRNKVGEKIKHVPKERLQDDELPEYNEDEHMQEEETEDVPVEEEPAGDEFKGVPVEEEPADETMEAMLDVLKVEEEPEESSQQKDEEEPNREEVPDPILYPKVSVKIRKEEPGVPDDKTSGPATPPAEGACSPSGDDPKAPADEEFKELPENVENRQVFQLEGDDDFLIDITSGLLSAMLPHVNVSSRT
ncbi:unnamed protein product [Cladocopium goreaui]|uniref:Uncharacterized protein n=1 Tax=Cladocopium goreaui TaxID=2562237 RepID=A0A9P1D7A8_9DINO|nr:unnamed protein product [Cladocopium goreaui]